MNLSSRERRLLVVFGVVLVLMGGVFLFGRLSGGDAPIEVPDLGFPSPSPSVEVVVPTGSPTFAVPAGARDPFKP